MDKNDLKELRTIFEPMNKYYSILLKEKQAELKQNEENELFLLNYSLLIKEQIERYREEIIIEFKEEIFSDSKYLFDKALDFLIRKQYVSYLNSDTIDVWGHIKNDFKLLDLLDKMILEIDKLREIAEKEKLKLFIDKYLLIAKKELENESHFVVDATWLSAKAYANGDIVPRSVSNIIQILKAELRIPKKKKRIGISAILAKAIAERDSWKCQICKIDLSKESAAWEINHIDCNPSNNDPKNLELTCRKCNRKWRV